MNDLISRQAAIDYCYQLINYAPVSKKVVAASGIDTEKEIIVKAESGKIIIEQKG